MYPKDLRRQAQVRCGIGGNLVAELYAESLWTSLCRELSGALLIRMSTGDIFYGDGGGCTQLRPVLNSHAVGLGGNHILVIRYSSDTRWSRPAPQLFEKHINLVVVEGQTTLSLPVLGSAHSIAFTFRTDGNCILDVQLKTPLFIPTYTVCVSAVDDVALSLAVFSQALVTLLCYVIRRARELLVQYAQVYTFELGSFGIIAFDFFSACSSLSGSTSHHRLGENAFGPHPISSDYMEPLQQYYGEQVHPHLDVGKILHRFFHTAHVDDFLRGTQLSVETLLA